MSSPIWLALGSASTPIPTTSISSIISKPASIASLTVASSITTTTSKVAPSTTVSASVAATAAKISSTSKPSPSTETTTPITPNTPTAHHAPPNVTTIFKRRAMSDNLLKVIGSCERLVHAEIFIFIVAILESSALVFH